MRTDMPHERLQEFCIIDYTKEMLILAIKQSENQDQEEVVGVGQYGIDEGAHSAEVAFVVRDDYQRKGIGTELLTYLTFLARKQGLLGFTAEVLMENKPMLHIFESAGFDLEKRISDQVYELRMTFREVK
jgi:RimJ/RimL family protein N-acetyltransferase